MLSKSRALLVIELHHLLEDLRSCDAPIVHVQRLMPVTSISQSSTNTSEGASGILRLWPYARPKQVDPGSHDLSWLKLTP